MDGFLMNLKREHNKSYLFAHIARQKDKKWKTNGGKSEYKSSIEDIDRGGCVYFTVLCGGRSITKSIVGSHSFVQIVSTVLLHDRFGRHHAKWQHISSLDDRGGVADIGELIEKSPAPRTEHTSYEEMRGIRDIR